MVAWAFHEAFHSRLRERGMSRNGVRVVDGVVAAAAGIYLWFVLSFPAQMHALLSPAVGVVAAAAVCWLFHRGYRLALPDASALPVLIVGALAGCALGAYCAFFIFGSPGAGLYLSWGVSCLLAGVSGVGAVQRAVCVYARAGAVAAGDAGGDAGHTARADGVHDNGLSERAAPAAGRLRQRARGRLRART